MKITAYSSMVLYPSLAARGSIDIAISCSAVCTSTGMLTLQITALIQFEASRDMKKHGKILAAKVTGAMPVLREMHQLHQSQDTLLLDPNLSLGNSQSFPFTLEHPVVKCVMPATIEPQILSSHSLVGNSRRSYTF